MTATHGPPPPFGCERVSLLLHEWLRDELNPATRAEVETHLEACARCSRERLELDRLDQCFASSPGPSLEEVASARLSLRRAMANEEATSPVSRFLPPGVQVAFTRAAAFVLSIGLLVPVASNLSPMAENGELTGSGDSLDELWDEVRNRAHLGIEGWMPKLPVNEWLDVIQPKEPGMLERLPSILPAGLRFGRERDKESWQG